MMWEAARAAAAVALFLAGLAAGGRGRLEQLVSRYLLYVAVPLIVFYKVLTAELGIVAAYGLLVGWSMGGSLLLAAVLVPRLLRGAPRETVGAAVLAAGIHNAGFLPIPLVLLFYGDAGPPALYSTMANLYMAWAMPLVAGAYSPRTRGGLGGAVRGLLGYPPFYALAAAALLRLGSGTPSGLPLAVLGPVYRAAAESTLASFLLVGSVLGRAGLSLDRAVAVVAAWRLAVEPALTVGLLAAADLGLEGVWLATALIEAFMPPATMNLVVALEYGLDYALVARAIGVV
ncbi:MAG: hypothetical protein GXO15_05605, partial [Crenarchaeota archaeon]|nr:hypothetical protein [Thermoproteota archaeon]